MPISTTRSLERPRLHRDCYRNHSERPRWRVWRIFPWPRWGIQRICRHFLVMWITKLL